jgi:putative two-component system response regulator
MNPSILFEDEQAKSVILSLAHSVEAKHRLTEGHSARLMGYAVQLGESLDLAEDVLEELRIASLLHDIGKIAVPDAILLKPGPLNAEETEIIKQHPITGEKICAPVKSLRHILPVIRHHHERMDGSGYPDGLSGDEIPLRARILQVADIYNALISDRPYREAFCREKALEILHLEARNGWLDASLVWKFSRICTSGEYFPVKGRSMLASYYA